MTNNGATEGNDDRHTTQRWQLSDIMRRIEALLNTANHPATNAEMAANYALMAQRLMLTYDITEERLAAHTEQVRDPVETVTITPEDMGLKSGDLHWRLNLMGKIASYNFCAVWWYTSRRDGKVMRLLIAGRAGHRQIVQYLYHYLARELVRLRVQEWERVRPYTRTHWLTWANQFYQGAIDTIHLRLHLERERLKAQGMPPEHDEAGETEDGSLVATTQDGALATGQQITALVVVEDAALKEYVEGLERERIAAGFRKQKTVKLNKPVVDGTAYSKGRRAAESLPLRPGLEEQQGSGAALPEDTSSRDRGATWL